MELDTLFIKYLYFYLLNIFISIYYIFVLIFNNYVISYLIFILFLIY